MAAQPATIFTRKPVEQLVEETKERGRELRRAVGLLDLTALGLGAVVGTGIFVIIGEAIAFSGPSIILAFVLAGITCVFSALSYGELASTIPVAGSAYSYSYATMGEFVAWVIGWDLILEYGLAVAAVAVGWGGYIQELLDSLFGITLSKSISAPPGEGGSFNLPAVALIAGVGVVLAIGVRESARANRFMVFFKVAVLLLFIVLGLTAFTSDNLSPFFIDGFNGVEEAAAVIFFAYIGFDAISTSGEECERPARDMPIAIISALAIATALYIAVATVAVGVLPFEQLKGQDAPLAVALDQGAGLSWGADVISLGALVAITSVVLTTYYGQTRIGYAMSRDGLLPAFFARLWEARRTPIVLTIVFGIATAALAAFIPLKDLALLVNIGTLFAFMVVNIGVIILRRTQPDLERGFRVPFVPVFPLIGAGLCLYLMSKLDAETWLRFGIWLAIGIVIYALYGRTHSRLRRKQEPAT